MLEILNYLRCVSSGSVDFETISRIYYTTSYWRGLSEQRRCTSRGGWTRLDPSSPPTPCHTQQQGTRCTSPAGCGLPPGAVAECAEQVQFPCRTQNHKGWHHNRISLSEVQSFCWAEVCQAEGRAGRGGAVEEVGGRGSTRRTYFAPQTALWNNNLIGSDPNI